MTGIVSSTRPAKVCFVSIRVTDRSAELSESTQRISSANSALAMTAKVSMRSVIKMDMQMTLYLAWAVRIALLMLYLPVQILSIIVQGAHRLDLWTSTVLMQSATQFGDRQFSTHFGGSANSLRSENRGVAEA